LSTKCLLLITKRLSKELNIHQKTIQKEDTNCSQGYQYNMPTASNMSIVFWIYIYGLRSCIKKSLGKRVMRNLAIVGPLQNKTWQQTHIMLVKMTFLIKYTTVTLQYSALSIHNNDHHASKWWTLWFSLSCWVQVTYCCFSSEEKFANAYPFYSTNVLKEQVISTHNPHLRMPLQNSKQPQLHSLQTFDHEEMTLLLQSPMCQSTQ